MSDIAASPPAKATSIVTGKDQREKAMRFSAEWWAFWSGVWAVGLTVGAALAGLVAWWASTTASARSDERTKMLELRVAETRERAALLEVEVSKQREKAAQAELRIVRLQKWGWPRGELFQPEPFINALNGAPTGHASVWFIPGDYEARALGSRIVQSLKTAGWSVTDPQGIPEDAHSGDLWKKLTLEEVRQRPLPERIGGQAQGVTLISRRGGLMKTMPDVFADPLIGALGKALSAALSGASYGSDSAMTDGEIRIVIGRNPWNADAR